jgi:signal transduction histidine kinase/CheY-like chemotaxis protein
MKNKELIKAIISILSIGIIFYLMKNYIFEIISIKFIISNILFSTIFLILLFIVLKKNIKIRKALYLFLFKETEERYNKKIDNFEIEELHDIIINYYLQKRELETAKETAEMQGKAKEVFLQNMSHEIRTPLNGIVIMSEMLKYTELNEKQKRYVATIIKVSNTLIGVINNILDYSKMQVQRTVINDTQFNIREIMAELKSFFISGSKGELFIIFTLSEDVPEIVTGDSFRLKQILINIIGNAVKFTPKGIILLKVNLKKREGNRAVISFEVSDTGIGIPEEKKGELFNSFMQADESISRRYGGTGLGLAISKEITEAMGGEIRVESIVKKGSKFLIDIPFDINQDRKQEKFNSESIIIIEDRPEICSLLLMVLSQYELITYICDSTEEADSILKEFEKEKIAIITRSKIIEKDRTILELINSKKIQNKIIIIKDNEYLSEEVYKNCNFIDYPIEQEELINIIKCIFGYECNQKVSFENEERFVQLKKKIAVIEDNEVNAKAIVEMIESFGAEVKLFENGIDALRELKESNYDLIISDIQLPDLSGFELMKLIREYDISQGNRRGIIALTAHALSDYKYKCLKAGFDDYISKPVTMQELYKVIALNTGEIGNIDEKGRVLMDKINSDIFKKLRRELQETALKSFEKIKESIAKNELEIVLFELHKLKGSFGNAKEMELYEMCVTLEKLGKEKDSNILEQYEKCFKLFKERFEI